MSFPLALRPQRPKTGQSEVTQQLIVFPLGQERFALPIQAVYRVIMIDNLYGGGAGHTSLTLYQDQELPVIDIKHRIFSANIPYPLSPETKTNSAIQLASQSLLNRPLLIVQNLQNELVGLAIDAQPFLRRVSESAFMPLSSTYLQAGNIKCVSNVVTLAPGEAPVFLLNLHQLLQG
jgi:chemotaxis signal transduction protein